MCALCPAREGEAAASQSTSKMALEARPMCPVSPGLANTRCSESRYTGLWKVSVCTVMPPVASSAIFISYSPTCGEKRLCHSALCHAANRLRLALCKCPVGQSAMSPSCEALLTSVNKIGVMVHSACRDVKRAKPDRGTRMGKARRPTRSRSRHERPASAPASPKSRGTCFP